MVMVLLVTIMMMMTVMMVINYDDYGDGFHHDDDFVDGAGCDAKYDRIDPCRVGCHC